MWTRSSVLYGESHALVYLGDPYTKCGGKELVKRMSRSLPVRFVLASGEIC